MSRRFVYGFDRAVTQALGPNGRYIAMTGMTATAVLLTYNYKFAEAIAATDNTADVQSPSKLFYLRLLFGRTRSRLTGWLLNKPVSPRRRIYIYEALAKIYGINLDEIRYPLQSYKCVGHFFARTLKDKEREIEDISPHALASPADAVVMSVGDVVSERVEQVKGATYNLRAFLGVPLPPAGKPADSPSLKYVVLYLQPKNYHHFHSPTHFDVQALRHISGETLPVFPGFLKRFNLPPGCTPRRVRYCYYMPDRQNFCAAYHTAGWGCFYCEDVFAVQERVVLSGRWLHGSMHFAAVAAYNVGNIRIDAEPELRTNELRTVLRYLGGDIELKTYTGKPLEYAVGQHIGEFRMGSAVVVVFEAPAEFSWNVKPRDTVRVGQRLGGVGPPKHAANQAERKFAFY